MRRVTINGLLARKLRLALTALAIVLGVTFVTGTLVLSDTLNRTFDNLVGTAYQHVSFQIRGKAAFGSASSAAVNGAAYRAPIPQSIATAVRRVPGVASVFGSVSGYAQFVSRNGNAIGKGSRRSMVGFSFDPNTRLSPYRLVAGTAPKNGHDVVMDKATATKYHFAVGDAVRVLLPHAPQTFTVSGIVTFGTANSLVGTTLAGFDASTAQNLFDSRGRYQTVNVLAAPGANTIRLHDAIVKVLPRGVEVVSGQTAVRELQQAINNGLSFLSTALLIFAFISLFVGAFTIVNTFTITVGQRTRELALLRIVGASRRQVFVSVMSEAAATGLAASLIGLGLGVVAAVGLKALLGAFGITLPSAPLVFEGRTVVVAIGVGVGVTLLSAVLPARHAIRIPPVAALVDNSEQTPAAPARGRVLAGCAAGAVGIAAVLAGAIGTKLALVGIGAVGVFIAAGVLVPIIAGPLARALGRPLATRGVPGRLGRANSMRNPRRTAQTAGALMIGIALVSSIAVLGNSLTTSAIEQVDSAVNADYLVTSSGGFSKSVPPTLSKLPGVGAITSVYRGQFEFKASLSSLAAVSPANLAQTVNLQVTAGAGASALAAGKLLVDTNTAATNHLRVGSLVAVRFARTGADTMRIGGIFRDNPLVGSFVTGEQFFLAHFNDPLPTAALVKTAPGTTGFEGTLKGRLAAYPNLTIQSREQFESQQKANVNRLLGLVYVLLALAVVVALIGIVNTLILSVLERTREIGLLRAVGMKRRQVRVMIRSEAVIIALLGALVGVAVGTGLGLALASALRNNGVTNISVPVIRLILFVILSALLGRIAAIWPARRAAELDVLAAIATQ